MPRRPLLVIDGDSFARRSYHALPKTILRRGRKPAGATWLCQHAASALYREEQPRAVCSSMCCRNLLPPAAFRMPKRQASRLMIFSLPLRQKKKSAAARSHCERRPRHVPACLRPHRHSLSSPRGRDGAHRSQRGSGAIWRRSNTGSGFHRLARRPLGQGARRTRRWRNRRCDSAAEIRQS